MNFLLGDFNAKVGREDIFKTTISNESLHEISNDNEITVVKLPHPRILTVRSTMFSHRNIHKFTSISPDGKTHNQIEHILIDRRRRSNVLDVRSGQQIVILTIICFWQHLGRDWRRVNKQHADFIWRSLI
jgi:hypothetical protein